MNKQELILRTAKKKGYTVDSEGIVFNLKGDKINLTKSSKKYSYLSFNLRIGKSNPTRCFVHRLQAFQKYGSKMFKDKIVVRHKNNVSTDNSKKNILIGTQKQNMQDRPKEQRIVNASSPKHDHEQIIYDRNLGMKYKQIMKKYSISSLGTISFIINKSLKQVS